MREKYNKLLKKLVPYIITAVSILVIFFLVIIINNSDNNTQNTLKTLIETDIQTISSETSDTINSQVTKEVMDTVTSTAAAETTTIFFDTNLLLSETTIIASETEIVQTKITNQANISSDDELINNETSEQGEVTMKIVENNYYVEGELIGLAESEEKALEIAELYGITLKKFQYGVATFETDEDLKLVIKRGLNNGYPTLEYNYISHAFE